MKSICILCESGKLIEANALALSITKSEILKTPLSKDGKAPATHWFCYLQTTQEGFEQLKGLEVYCSVVEGNAKDFLNANKLEIIREEKTHKNEENDRTENKK